IRHQVNNDERDPPLSGPFSFGEEGLSESGGKSLALGCPVGDGSIYLAPPLVGKINNKPGSWCAACHGKDIVKNGAVLISVVGFSQGMPEWPVEVKHAWGFHHHSQFSYQGKRNCCYSASLDFACQQSHGPRTDRSVRYQDHEINRR